MIEVFQWMQADCSLTTGRQAGRQACRARIVLAVPLFFVDSAVCPVDVVQVQAEQEDGQEAALGEVVQLLKDRGECYPAGCTFGHSCHLHS